MAAYKFTASDRFWKHFDKLPEAQKRRTITAFEIFKKDPFDRRLRTHKINGLSGVPAVDPEEVRSYDIFMKWLQRSMTYGTVFLMSQIPFIQATGLLPERDSAQGAIKLQVVEDGTNQPISGAMICFWSNADSDPEVVESDTKGEHIFHYSPKKSDSLFFHATKAGFLPLLIQFEQISANPPPAEYKVTLQKGSTMGGVVQDENGHPIPNVKVKFFYAKRLDEHSVLTLDAEEDCCACSMLKMSPSLHKQLAVFHEPYALKTDSNGRWVCHAAPSHDEGWLWVWLKHPDFVSDSKARDMESKVKSLRDLTNVETMHGGLRVTGTVLDREGKPVEGATVIQGEDHFGSNLDYPEAKTDFAGRFAFGPSDAGRMVLTVQSPKHAPDILNILVGQGMKPVEFRLGPTQRITGRVIDKNGKPVPGVLIAADTWRKHRSLDWRTQTDQEGRFIWNNPPSDDALCCVLKAGFMGIRNTGIHSRPEEYIFTLLPPLEVSGKVTDEKTGQSISKFQIVWGSQYEDGSIYWVNEPREVRRFTGGMYHWRNNEPSHGYLLRVEAQGYASQISRPIKIDEGQVSLDFKMRPGNGTAIEGGGLVGKVVDAEGKPANEAVIVVATKRRGVSIENGQLDARQCSNTHVTSDPKGAFSLPPEVGEFSLVALHDTGYAELSSTEFMKSSTLVLKPWAKIEGVCRKEGGGVAAGYLIAIDYDGPVSGNSVYRRFSTKTDEKGGFRFHRVFPGPALVMVGVGTSHVGEKGLMVGSSHGVFVDVKPRQTYHVELGGHGRSVIGQIKLPKGVSIPLDSEESSTELTLQQGKVTIPDGLNVEQRRSWYDKWEDSPEGKAYRHGSRRDLMTINKDGTIHADDILPGKYKLEVLIYEPDPREPNQSLVVAIGAGVVEVPERSLGLDVKPIDLGTIQLVSPPRSQRNDSDPHQNRTRTAEWIR